MMAVGGLPDHVEDETLRVFEFVFKPRRSRMP